MSDCSLRRCALLLFALYLVYFMILVQFAISVLLYIQLAVICFILSFSLILMLELRQYDLAVVRMPT